MPGVSISGYELLTYIMLEKKVMIIQKTPMHCMSIRGQELVTGMTWNPFFLCHQQSLFNAGEFIYLGSELSRTLPPNAIYLFLISCIGNISLFLYTSLYP